MTWTYAGTPGTASTAEQRDAVRFWVGDTDTSDQLVTDEEIGFAIDNQGSLKSASAEVARAIAAKYSRQADKEVGDLSIKLSQRAVQYLSLATSLDKQAARASASPFLGGSSISSKDSYKTAADRVRPAFEVGQFAFRSNSTSYLST